MRVTLASRLKEAVSDVKQFRDGALDPAAFMAWCDKYQVLVSIDCIHFNKFLHVLSQIDLFQAQIVVLAVQIMWSEEVEAALQSVSSSTEPKAGVKALQPALKQVEATLNVLADSVLQEQPPLRRRKLEHLVIIHQ